MVLPEFVDNENLKKYNLEDSCNREDIIIFINDTFGARWKRSYPYKMGREIVSKTKALPENLLSNKIFNQHICYANVLAKSYLDDGFNELDEKLRNEVLAAEESGGLCIYVSVVLYCLLLESGVVNAKDLDYIQGYYKHELREDFPKFIPFGKNHLGLHSFLRVKGSTIDPCIIPQEYMFFDFKDEDIIMGNIPDKFELVGFKESYSVVMEYAEEYAAKSGLTYKQWVEYHMLNSELVILKELQKHLLEKYDELLNL